MLALQKAREFGQLADNTYLIDSTLNSTGAPSYNPYNNAATLHVSSLLTDANDWYLIMSLPGITPFMTVKHTTSKPALIPKIADTDLNVMEEKEYRWLLDMAEETYPVHYFQMVKYVNS